jgi:hypothetical protein
MQSGVSKNNGKEWQKVEFVVEESDKTHPDTLCICAFNDKVTELVGINQGDEVEVEFDCRVNEYNGRVFNSLMLYNIEKVGAPQQAPQPMPQPQQPVRNDTIFQGDDDLPF